MTMPAPDALWLNVSPSLQYFDRPLLRCLSQSLTVAQWQYAQTDDEGSSFDEALALLHTHLCRHDRPLHLIGHGLSGVLGLIYARFHPERVRSLTLLAVAAQPAITWHAHYYVQRHLLPWSQSYVLAQTVRSLFGSHLPTPIDCLVTALEQDLATAPSFHSLLHLEQLPQGGIAAPLLICSSQTDTVVHPPLVQAWKPWLKATDRLWECPVGRHFFHYFCSRLVAQQIIEFTRSPSHPTPIPQFAPP